MTSETRAYVWAWLPDSTDPIVVGRLDLVGDVVTYRYAPSYLARSDATSLFAPELPLIDTVQYPIRGLAVAGCIADGGPDAWGQRVILHRRFGTGNMEHRFDDLGPLGFLLESGSDRFGALDFQASATDYVPRATQQAPLEDLLTAADRLDAGEPLDATLELALLHGSSLGGARPKALLEADDGRSLIAKFARRSDPYPVVRAEAAAMWLADQVGLGVAATSIVDVAGSDVLLVERFDRPRPDTRSMVVSALTQQGLDPVTGGRYATYTALANDVRLHYTDPGATLAELFRRIAFNMCIGNTDDHARNHAAFWDGTTELLTLTPAFDLCPQTRSGGETFQVMAYDPDGVERRSRLSLLVAAARQYHLELTDAQDIVDDMVETIRTRWVDAADHARLTKADRNRLWQIQILNPSIFHTED